MGAELYFDVGSPYSFLAIERAERVLGELPRLKPVLLGGLFKLGRRSSWGVGNPALREAGMLEVESRAMAYDLPAIRWPRPRKRRAWTPRPRWPRRATPRSSRPCARPPSRRSPAA